MLTNIIETCPDNLWNIRAENKSICKRVLHVLESVDYWLKESGGYFFDSMFNGYSAEMDMENSSLIDKGTMIEYNYIVKQKVNRFFQSMNDSILLKNSSIFQNTTYLDIILCQIRHIQINLGYCNEIFNNNGIICPDWLGYNEEYPAQ